ncbi:MAG: hypothetical protein Q8N05_14465 [Bacteroidota bacterium]|nr:hypothetical protein [Bacteroidota bacterium]
MKKQIIISILFLVVAMTIKAQKSPGFSFYTDRDEYVSGETLLAKIYTPSENKSRIVYLDLVNKYGTRISGVSTVIKNNQADGFFQLPDSLSSGTYLLRAYLKNTAAKLKIIREIWISNRFDGLEKTNQINRLLDSENIQDTRSSQIEIENINPAYATNSNIGGTIKIDETLLNEIDGNLMVCVAQTDPSFIPASYTWSASEGKEGLNEKKGMILTGTITDKKTSEPASGITVYLTIPDSIPGFQYYKTRNNGRFYFLLDNYYGSVQAIVQCFGNTPAQRLKIRMDELFAEPGTLPKFKQQSINEEFKTNQIRNIEAVTFQKIFGQNKIKLSTPPVRIQEDYAYYGRPTSTVNPHLFIDLPNFTEVSRELLAGVKFRNYNNEPTMQVINTAKHYYFEENPLVLIDGIPIRDLNLIKDMGTVDIKRVDICQSERFYGDLRFPGVVAIYATKADYSRLPESDQFIRLKLEGFQVPSSLAPPEISESSIPDLRQVIFWNPSLEPDRILSVNCNTSAITGQYKLIVRGRLKNGTMIFAEKQFEVK